MKEMLECVWSCEVQERGKQRDQIEKWFVQFLAICNVENN